MVEAVRQLNAYFVIEIEEAATHLIATVKTWPPFAEIRERADKIRANNHGAPGGLRTFRDRSPDKTPAQIKRAIEHCAELRTKFPDAPWPEKQLSTEQTHWADRGDLRDLMKPLTAEQVESYLRVTGSDVHEIEGGE